MGKAEQINTRYRWYAGYLANRRSETGPWNYVDLRMCLVDRELNEALHREIGADVALELLPPDIEQRSFDDEPTHADTHLTRLIEVE